MDTWKMKQLIEEMMTDLNMTLEQAQSKAEGIIAVACDLIAEEEEERREYEAEQEREALEYEMKKNAMLETGISADDIELQRGAFEI